MSVREVWLQVRFTRFSRPAWHTNFTSIKPRQAGSRSAPVETAALDSFPVEPSSQGGGFFDSDEEFIAAVEREIGPEAAEATRRSQQLARNPRALTDPERALLRATVEPILRDLRTSGAIVPDVVAEAHDDAGPDRVAAWIQPAPGADYRAIGSQGIYVQADLSLPERLADLADQIQEWEVEELSAAGRPATWPECPQHPNTHPLTPEARGDQAAWCCPRTGQVIAGIGALQLA
jgi:hypothetical protein